MLQLNAYMHHYDPPSTQQHTPHHRMCAHVPLPSPCSKQKKALQSMKFPKELSLPVDHDRINWTVMKEWIAKRVTDLLGIEEEVLIGTIHNYLIDQRVRIVGCFSCRLLVAGCRCQLRLAGWLSVACLAWLLLVPVLTCSASAVDAFVARVLQRLDQHP